MCTYNGARYLREQLDSIAMQTRLPDELVICDDRSTDNTEEIVKAVRGLSQAISGQALHVNDRNLGSVKNFEKAIGLCEGDIIALSDQDDVWHPDKLKLIEETFLRMPGAGLVFSDLEMVDENLRTLGYRAWQCQTVQFKQEEQALLLKGRALDVLLTRNMVVGCAMAFRARFKNLVLPIPGISEWLYHDYWIALMVSSVADLAFIDRPLMKYRQHPNQQLGLLPPPESGMQGAATFRSRISLAQRCLLLSEMYDRLSARNDFASYRQASAKIAARITHSEVRGSMRRRKFVSRLLFVSRELLTLRYFLYSNGLRDATKDLAPSTLLRCAGASLLGAAADVSYAAHFGGRSLSGMALGRS